MTHHQNIDRTESTPTTMNNMASKLSFKNELRRHLEELGHLIGRPVLEPELLSPTETKAIQAQAKQIPREPSSSFEINFEEKDQPRFHRFLAQISQANTNDVFIWTPASNTCGVLRPLPLSNFKTTFPFDINPEGIISI